MPEKLTNEQFDKYLDRIEMNFHFWLDGEAEAVTEEELQKRIQTTRQKRTNYLNAEYDNEY